MLVGHVTKEGEDHKAGEETGQRVDGAGDDGISGKEENKIRRRKQSEVISHQTVNVHINDEPVNEYEYEYDRGGSRLVASGLLQLMSLESVINSSGCSVTVT